MLNEHVLSLAMSEWHLPEADIRLFKSIINRAKELGMVSSSLEPESEMEMETNR